MDNTLGLATGALDATAQRSAPVCTLVAFQSDSQSDRPGLEAKHEGIGTTAAAEFHPWVESVSVNRYNQ